MTLLQSPFQKYMQTTEININRGMDDKVDLIAAVDQLSRSMCGGTDMPELPE